MFGTYFYNKNIRNMVSTFGTVFNNISVRRVNASNVVLKEIKVPLSYGPAEKFLVRLNQDLRAKSNNPFSSAQDTTIQLTLPRMSFEINSIAYDPARKLQTIRKLFDVTNRHKNDGTGTAGRSKLLMEDSIVLNGIPRSGFLLERFSDDHILAEDGTKIGGDAGLVSSALYSVFNPVPFNFDITLSIMVQYSEDGTQILEQILPYFTPEFNITLKEFKDLSFTRDIPIIFNGLTTEDTYEGDYLTRRAIIHTLTFTMKGFLYGQKTSSNLIKTVIVDTFDVNKTDISSGTDVIQTVTPDPTTADATDDFGFTETLTEMPEATNL